MRRALVLVSVLLLAAACGGGDDDPKAAYIEKAESSCSEANERLAELNKQRPSDVGALPAYVHSLVDIAKQTLEEISELTPPAADADDVESKLIAPLRAQLRNAETFATEIDVAAAKKDNAKLFALVSNPPTKTQVDIAWMKTYGFKDCVKAADTGAATR